MIRVLQRAAARAAGIVGLILSVSCGSTPAAPSNGGSNTGGSTSNTITITAAGVSPKTIQITLGSRVLFINNDTRPHNMATNPHPEHTDCDNPLKTVGFLTPGQRRETENFVIARTCGFHDHDNSDDTSLQGSITAR
jgi:plastocyanin